MKIEDNGIIIKISKHSESNAIISIFSEYHGLLSGYVKYYNSKKNLLTYQIGNLVNFIWNARLDDHLGSLQCEIDISFASNLINESSKLLAIGSLCSLLANSLTEGTNENKIYNELVKFFHLLLHPDQISYDKIMHNKWIADYIKLELYILKELGFGLELDKCVVSESDQDLTYISPKSGKAVSKKAGELYKDKLFLLPEIFSESNNINKQDVNLALKITEYFIEKHFLKPKNLSSNFYKSNLIKLFSVKA